MKHTLFLFLLFFLQGCSALWYPTAETETTEVTDMTPVAPPPVEEEIQTSGAYEQFAGSPPDVEVIWAIPDSPVEQYIIQYGFSRESLNNSVTVSAANLERYEDPAHGFVYKYVLKGIPEFQTIFVSLTAQAGEETSPPSPVFEIPGK